MRAWHAVAYVAYVIREIWAGSLRVARAALTPTTLSRPAIVELPLRCRTDLEIVALASSITITPGTLVVGTAAAHGEAPPTLFVHVLFSGGRAADVASLRDMESRLLRVTRSRHEAAPTESGAEHDGRERDATARVEGGER